MDSEEREFWAGRPCQVCGRDMGSQEFCPRCIPQPAPGWQFPIAWCGTGRNLGADMHTVGGSEMLSANEEYSFGLAVEVAMRLEWWCNPSNPYHLRAAPKLAWTAAVANALLRGDTRIPTPASFGVKPTWKVDVLLRAREMGLPF